MRYCMAKSSSYFLGVCSPHPAIESTETVGAPTIYAYAASIGSTPGPFASSIFLSSSNLSASASSSNLLASAASSSAFYLRIAAYLSISLLPSSISFIFLLIFSWSIFFWAIFYSSSFFSSTLGEGASACFELTELAGVCCAAYLPFLFFFPPISFYTLFIILIKIKDKNRQTQYFL